MGYHFEVLKTSDASPAATAARKTHTQPENPGAARARGPIENEFAKLAQRLFILPGSAKAPGAVAFCGVEAGAGCSWVCAQCGEALAAQVPGSVCVVDANFRNPSLHAHFGVTTEDGFAQALADSRPIANFARRVAGASLWFVPAGIPARQSRGVLNPAYLRTRFSQLRAQFDYVLVDTPAMTAFPDGALLSQLADGAVLVVRSDMTRRDAARMVKESLETAKVPVLGVVFNRRTYPMPEALYRRL